MGGQVPVTGPALVLTLAALEDYNCRKWDGQRTWHFRYDSLNQQ